MEYHEWDRFTMQLQLWVLVAMEYSRALGFVVRRHRYSVEILRWGVKKGGRYRGAWEPLSWPVWEHSANGLSCPAARTHSGSAN